MLISKLFNKNTKTAYTILHMNFNLLFLFLIDHRNMTKSTLSQNSNILDQLPFYDNGSIKQHRINVFHENKV